LPHATESSRRKLARRVCANFVGSGVVGFG
jgi:hypothetical protein